MSTPDSRTTAAAGQAATPGQAAYEAFMRSPGNNRVSNTDAWEAAGQAAIDWWHADRDLEPPQAITGIAPAREQVIARLAAAFGPHKAAVSRKPDEDHRHPWTEFVPSGNDERGSTLIVFRDTDGQNSMRPLTYGEIADALCEPPGAIAAAAPAAPLADPGDLAEQWFDGTFDDCDPTARAAMLDAFRAGWEARAAAPAGTAVADEHNLALEALRRQLAEQPAPDVCECGDRTDGWLCARCYDAEFREAAFGAASQDDDDQPQPAPELPAERIIVSPGDGTAIGGLLAHVMGACDEHEQPQPAPELAAARPLDADFMAEVMAERDRLRAALREIGEGDPVHGMTVRAALEGK